MCLVNIRSMWWGMCLVYRGGGANVGMCLVCMGYMVGVGLYVFGV